MANKETIWFKSQRDLHTGKVPAHLASATELTRFGQINLANRVFRRHGRLKTEARHNAVLNMEHDGKLPFPNRARGTYINVMTPLQMTKTKKRRNVEDDVIVEKATLEDA